MAVEFKEDGDDFLLIVTNAKGRKSQVRMTEADALNITQSATLWRERIVSRYHPKSEGTVQAILATPVVQFRVTQDSLAVDVLLTLQAPNGAELTFAIPSVVANLLAKKLGEEIVSLAQGQDRSKQ